MDRLRGPRLERLLALGLAILTSITVAKLLYEWQGRPAPVGNGASGQFPAPPALSRAVVWAVGDGAVDLPSARALARRIAADRPDRFLYLGDVYQRGTAAEFRENYDRVYGRLRAITAPTPGNHDWPRHADGYDPYWSTLTGGRPPAHYSFRLAGWQILSLNSEEPLGSDSRQLRWLSRRIRDPGTCRLAFWHRPRYSAGEHGDQDDVDPLWRALRGRARLVVNGHDHNLQRLRPIDGITEMIAGAGGKSRYDLDEDDNRLAFARADVDGALRLELSRGLARYRFVTATGDVLDSGLVRCTP